MRSSSAPTVIRGGHVLTMDAASTQVPGGSVVIRDDTIEQVLAAGAPIPDGAEVIDATGHLVMPGMINAHTHVSQTLLRGGLSHSRILYEWLMNVVLPGLRAYGEGDLRAAVHLYCAEALCAGITTIVANEEPMSADPADDVRTVLDALEETGIRAAYALMFRDSAPAAVRAGFVQDDDVPLPHEEIGAALTLVGTFAERYGTSVTGPRRAAVWPSPATTAVVSDDGLRAAHEHAARFGGRWALHLAETTTEAMVREHSPVEHLARLGCLDASLLAAHCVHVDRHDLDRLAVAGVNVVTNPVSNAYLGSGIAPVPEMLRRGVRLALGTDDGNCNDAVNLISDMKTLALLHRATSGDPRAIDPETIVRMTTIDAARCIGADRELGSIEPGKRADIAVLRTDRPQMAPMHDPYAVLVFQAAGTEVSTVLVDGSVVVHRGVPVFCPDLRALCADAGTRSARIARDAGLPSTPRSPR